MHLFKEFIQKQAENVSIAQLRIPIPFVISRAIFCVKHGVFFLSFQRIVFETEKEESSKGVVGLICR